MTVHGIYQIVGYLSKIFTQIQTFFICIQTMETYITIITGDHSHGNRFVSLINHLYDKTTQSYLAIYDSQTGTFF